MSGTNVFVSYGREDIVAARRIYAALEGAGHRPWMDEKDLLPGQHWEAAIRVALSECRFYILLLSTRCVSRKGFLHREIGFALKVLETYPKSQIFLIPARLDDCEFPDERLNEIHRVDMFPDWDLALNRIVVAVGHYKVLGAQGDGEQVRAKLVSHTAPDLVAMVRENLDKLKLDRPKSWEEQYWPVWHAFDGEDDQYCPAWH